MPQHAIKRLIQTEGVGFKPLITAVVAVDFSTEPYLKFA